MSYTKVKNMAIKKDGAITITAASSNVSPTKYVTEELKWKENFTMDEKLRFIFDDLIGGMLQFNDSSTSRVFYGYLKAIGYFKKHYPHLTIQDLWWSEYDKNPTLTEEEANKHQSELYRVFKEALMEPVSMTPKRYAVKLNTGAWFRQSLKWKYRVSHHTPKFFPINQALLYSMNYDGKIIKKEKVE